MTINIGFIGTGGFTRFHCKVLSGIDGVNVTAFCGSSMEKADKLASQYSNASAYGNLDQMLDAERLDAVYICVPPMAHGNMENALVEREIPFLVEKPLGLDLEVPSGILKRIQEKRLITSVGYHFRYADATAKLKERLNERKIGMALGYWMGGMPRVGWWRLQSGSGGQFIEQTTHIVDLLRYTIGEVREVYAAYASRVMYEVEENVTVPDVGTVTMKLENGAVATVSNTCLLPEGHLTGLHVYTDQGVLEWSPNGLKDLMAGRTLDEKNLTNPYETEARAFLHAVQTGDTSQILSTYEDAFRTQCIAVSAHRSAEIGAPVIIQT